MVKKKDVVVVDFFVVVDWVDCMISRLLYNVDQSR
jgi:hypothetical protein